MSDRALWAQAQQDYTQALAIANLAWAARGDATPEAIQAATATLLIHVTKLRERGGVTPQPAAAAPTRGVRGTASAAVGVPPCPQCGGGMRDARAEKRTDKSPDFVCVQQNGACGKPNAKGKWYPTASWAEKPAVAQATQIRNTIDSYAQPPAAIAGAVRGDATEDDLPF